MPIARSWPVWALAACLHAPGSAAMDAIDTPLDPGPADAARGRAIVADRFKGLCLLCHTAPIPEERFQGDIGPALAGVGDRLSVAQMRARLVDPSRVNPHSVMPAYHRTDHLRQVGQAWHGRPVLQPAEIEDVLAYLATLRASPAAGGSR